MLGGKKNNTWSKKNSAHATVLIVGGHVSTYQVGDKSLWGGIDDWRLEKSCEGDRIRYDTITISIFYIVLSNLEISYIYYITYYSIIYIIYRPIEKFYLQLLYRIGIPKISPYIYIMNDMNRKNVKYRIEFFFIFRLLHWNLNWKKLINITNIVYISNWNLIQLRLLNIYIFIKC